MHFFSVSDFKIRKSVSYPAFKSVIQSWYSPFIGNKKQDDLNYSACVTFGVHRNEVSGLDELILASVLNGIFSDSVQFLNYVKAMSTDYLNKTGIDVSTIRAANTVIFESEYKKFNPMISNVKVSGIYRFSTIHNGGEDLNDRINLAKTYIKSVNLTNAPDSDRLNPELRPDDSQFLERLQAYPNPGSYAMVSAFVQLLLYAGSFFNLKERRSDKAYSKPNKAFY